VTEPVAISSFGHAANAAENDRLRAQLAALTSHLLAADKDNPNTLASFPPAGSADGVGRWQAPLELAGGGERWGTPPEQADGCAGAVSPAEVARLRTGLKAAAAQLSHAIAVGDAAQRALAGLRERVQAEALVTASSASMDNALLRERLAALEGALATMKGAVDKSKGQLQAQLLAKSAEADALRADAAAAAAAAREMEDELLAERIAHVDAQRQAKADAELAGGRHAQLSMELAQVSAELRKATAELAHAHDAQAPIAVAETVPPSADADELRRRLETAEARLHVIEVQKRQLASALAAVVADRDEAERANADLLARERLRAAKDEMNASVESGQLDAVRT
jgi:hypothetical protein